MKFDRNVLQVNPHRFNRLSGVGFLTGMKSFSTYWRYTNKIIIIIIDLTSHFQDGGHDVIRSCHSESTQSVCSASAHMQQCPAVPDL